VDRDELVRKIVEEKGTDAIPRLMELINTGDHEVASTCLDAILQMSDSGRNALVEEMAGRIRDGTRNDIPALYMLDRLAETDDERVAQLAFSMLKLYDDERALLVLYESLAKLGHGDSIMGVLEAMIDEPMDEEMKHQVISALAFCGNRKAALLLEGMYKDPTISKSVKAFILEGFVVLLSTNPDLHSYVRNGLERGQEIIERVNHWLESRK